MDPIDELREPLAAMGWTFYDSAINATGRQVCRLTHDDGRSVAMFLPDVRALALGRASLEQIIARNRGADLADPWLAIVR